MQHELERACPPLPTLSRLQVGINGFGRIGRLTFRYLEAMRDEVEVVHINEILGGAETAAYLVSVVASHLSLRITHLRLVALTVNDSTS